MKTGTYETYDKDRIKHMNLARLKIKGERFEVAIDSEKAMAYKKGTLRDVREALDSEHVFRDAKKGSLAAEHDLMKFFKTKDPLEVADQIIKKGEVQLTESYRKKQQDEKRIKIIAIIHRNAVDPKTHLPHPMTRIENAFAEAKVHIDEFKSVEEQVNDIVKKLQPILPIRFELKEVTIKISVDYAAKAYGPINDFGKILKDEWLSDGSWLGVVEIPGGLEEELYDKINKITHGHNETSVKVK